MELLLPLLFLLPLLYIFSRTRKQQKAFAALQSRLAAGQEVMTTSGLYARIIEIDEGVAVLEASPGQRMRWARQAIARILDDPARPDVDPPASQAP